MHYFTYILIAFLHEVAYYYTQRNTKHIAFATDGGNVYINFNVVVKNIKRDIKIMP